MDTRERILRAAAEMIGEDPTAHLSVRAVAARAGVSTGSLRFHFPTQRELQDAVLARVYAHFIPDDPIHDSSVPARDRLVNCLRQVLAPTGLDADARRTWTAAYQTFIAPEPTPGVRAAYLSAEREGMRRVEYWLGTLANEGLLPRGDHTPQARFLFTVLSGLSFQRAVPTDESVLRAETETLYIAVDSVLGHGRPSADS